MSVYASGAIYVLYVVWPCALVPPCVRVTDVKFPSPSAVVSRSLTAILLQLCLRERHKSLWGVGPLRLRLISQHLFWSSVLQCFPVLLHTGVTLLNPTLLGFISYRRSNLQWTLLQKSRQTSPDHCLWRQSWAKVVVWPHETERHPVPGTQCACDVECLLLLLCAWPTDGVPEPQHD